MIWLKTIISLYILSAVLGSKLNVPRVLLPYNHDKPSNFTLKVLDGGCYDWTSSRTVVQLFKKVDSSGCSKEAVVSAVTRSPVRQTAIIIANEMISGISFRCDVIIDSIHHLEIVTTTRELFVEEAPEKFEIRGYDNLGNEFSTLEGQEFIWDLYGIRDDDSTMPSQSVLRFISFAASPYEAPHGIAPLEERGHQGYMVLVEGRQTGIARLSARMAHSLYKELPPVSVDLMVVANLILEPQDVYILPFTTVYYTVHQLKQGHLIPVKIKGTQYSLETTEPNIGKLEKISSSIIGLHQGTTLVKLKDSNVKSSLILKQPTASLHVVNPSYMTITVVPHNNPNLIFGEEYTFLVKIFDDLNNKILLTNNIVIQIDISSKHFDVAAMTKNGTYIHGRPKKIGATKITATLTSVEVEDDVLEISPSLEASLDLVIMKPIKVIPAYTLLPWDPAKKPKYNITLKVEENAGVVIWKSPDQSLVNVSSAGRCYTEGPGIALITASLAINSHNSDSSEILIKEATSLHLPPGVIEVEVGKLLRLGIALSTKMEHVDEMVFSSCLQVSLKVEIPDNIFKFDDEKLKPSDVPEACAVAALIGQSTGFSKVTVSYSSPQTNLKADAIIGAFNPLKVVSPETGETVLAVESSRIIVFEGGPLPWFSKPSSYYVRVNTNDTSVASADVMKKPIGVRVQSDVNAVYVECLKLGVMKLTLTVGNTPSYSLHFPQNAVASVTVRCASPDYIALKYNFRASSEMRPCPAQNELGFTIAHYLRPLFLDIIVLDSQGRKFDNISLLNLEWSISNENVAILSSSSFIQTKTVFGFNVPLEAEQEVKPNGILGNARIDVNLLGIFPTPRSSINVKFVDSATLQPANITLYNHKENKAELNIVKGSGFFHLEPVENSICSVTFLQKENKLVVHPIADGSTTVSLIDLCLQEEKSTTAVVKVASVGAVDFYMHDRVELGGRVYAEVIVKDKEGTVVPVHKMMSLTAHTLSNIIEATPQPRNLTSDLLFEGSAVFAIQGLRVGDASLRFNARISPSSSLKVFSVHKPIQVFPPLQILPKNVTLIVGAVYQVESKGGPYPDSSIEFIVGNETVAKSSHTGVLTAFKLGVTTLIARAISPERNGGKLVVYSQDTVTINVVMLTAIEIRSPLKKIEVGSVMPLYAVGQDVNQNPLAYASAIPALTFEWSVNNKVVMELHKLYEKNDVTESDENLGIVRVTALKPGRVNVNLKVIAALPPSSSSSNQIRKNAILQDTIEIMVFDSLKLLSPMTDDARILMTPHSSTRMVTNSRASEGEMTYAVDCHSGQQSTPVVSVSDDGVVSSGSSTGISSVIITRTESSGVKQQLAVLIEVEHVIYIQANPSRFMTVSESGSQNNVPIGASHTLEVTFHDNSGRIFHATNSELSFRPSRFDLVNFRLEGTNNTLNVTARGIGQTVLHIWDSKNPLINDFIRIETGPAILPFKDVTVGQCLILSSAMRNIHGDNGFWESDSSSLTIDAKTGIAVARKAGKVTVSYQLSSLSTTVELNIAPITKFKLWSPGAVSNIRKNEMYYAMFAIWPVDEEVIGNRMAAALTAPVWQSDCDELYESNTPSFTCNIIGSPVIEQYLSTSHKFIPGRGHACVITSLVGPLMNISRYTQEMELVVSTQPLVPNGPSASVKFTFYAAAVFEKSEAILSAVEPVSKNILIGHPHLLEHAQIIATENILFDVSYQRHNNNYMVVLTARLSKWREGAFSTPFVVTIDCVLNAQKINLTVHLVKVGTEHYSEDKNVGMVGLVLVIMNHYQGVLVSLVCLAVTAACMAIAYKSLTGSGYKQTSHKELFANSPDLDSSIGLAARNSQPSPNANKISPQTPRNLSFANNSHQLWSVDRQPIYGDPTFRSSPNKAYDDFPVYRRSP